MILDKLVGLVDDYLGSNKKTESPPKETGHPETAPAMTKSPLTATQKPPQPAEEEFAQKPYGLSVEAERFISDVIIPYKMAFHLQRCLALTYELVRVLDTGGLCPSVVRTRKKKDSEAFIPSTGKILEQVNLRDHSFGVARKIVGLRRARGKLDPDDIMVPNLVIAALSHDIGKIPEYRDHHQRRYVVADHPVVSASVVEGIYAFFDMQLSELVKEAILSHHRPTNDPYSISEYLQLADAAARETELKQLLDDAYRQWDNWFVLKDFVAFLEPEINIIAKGNVCQIFTYVSTLYATPDFLFRQAQKFAQSKGIYDPILSGIQDKAVSVKKIVQSLRANGMIDNLPGDYYGLPYIIDAGRFSFRMFLTPIKIEVLPKLPSIYEIRKTGWLNIIRSIHRYPATK